MILTVVPSRDFLQKLQLQRAHGATDLQRDDFDNAIGVRTDTEKLNVEIQHVGLVHLDQHRIGPQVRLRRKLDDSGHTAAQ